MELNFLQKRTWAEIDLDALEYNYRAIRDLTPDHAKICCTVKADAYGHGSVRVARLFEKLGADYLAVSNIKEALILRDDGIGLPILILGYTDPACAELLAKKQITQCVYSYEYGTALCQAAEKANVVIGIHIKLDVGMGRIGFVLHTRDESVYDTIAEICSHKCFRTEGVFTHFSMASEGRADKGITAKQYKMFLSAVEKLEQKGISFEIKHCSNSAAGLRYPELSLDMVRYGVALYGAMPCEGINHKLNNAMSLKTVISHIKKLKKGDTVSYGSEYTAKGDITVATLPIGYDDGFRRENFANGTLVSVNGILCPIIGRVCMDQTMIDISAVENARLGDEAVIYGSGSCIDLEAFCKNNKKIPYEAMCEISARVPRVYMKNGTVESIRDSFV